MQQLMITIHLLFIFSSNREMKLNNPKTVVKEIIFEIKKENKNLQKDNNLKKPSIGSIVEVVYNRSRKNDSQTPTVNQIDASPKNTTKSPTIIKGSSDIADSQEDLQQYEVVESPNTVSILSDLPSNSNVCDPDTKNTLKPTSDIPTNVISTTKCYVAAAGLVAAQESLLSVLKSLNVSIKHIYKEHIFGVSFCVEDNKIIEVIRNEAPILFIEEDTELTISALQSNIPNHMFLMKNIPNYVLNNYLLDNAFFRLFRIKEMYKYFFGSYEYFYTGKGVKVNLVDTTIDSQLANDQRVVNMSGRTASCNVHGNEVSKLIIGKTNGFAKETVLYNIDVVGCDGKIRLSDLLKSLEIIKKPDRTEILMLGVSGKASMALNTVLNEISRKNTIVVAPSGNNRDLACNYSPASAESVISVGSIDKHNSIARFSNYGSCSKIYTIGESPYKNEGTSYSAAIVSGAIAILLEKYPMATVEDVWKYLNANSTWNYNGYITFTLPELTQEYDTKKAQRPYRAIFYKYESISIGILIVILVVVFIYYVIRYVRKSREHEIFMVRPLDRF